MRSLSWDFCSCPRRRYHFCTSIIGDLLHRFFTESILLLLVRFLRLRIIFWQTKPELCAFEQGEKWQGPCIRTTYYVRYIVR